MMKALQLATFGLLVGLQLPLLATGSGDPWQALRKDARFVELHSDAHYKVEQRYATAGNFMGRALYGGKVGLFLHRDAYARLSTAAKALQGEKAGWKLLLFDGLRPRSVQWDMWAKVSGTADVAYVADPAKGSVHNFGMAIDLSLLDAHGKEVDMGTPYDSFEKLAQPQFEQDFVKEGKLSQAQLAHRLLLRRCMEQSGFISISNEWWHFDALPQKQVRATMQIVE